jgi:hypothetical protein
VVWLSVVVGVMCPFSVVFRVWVVSVLFVMWGILMSISMLAIVV